MRLASRSANFCTLRRSARLTFGCPRCCPVGPAYSRRIAFRSFSFCGPAADSWRMDAEPVLLDGRSERLQRRDFGMLLWCGIRRARHRGFSAAVGGSLHVRHLSTINSKGISCFPKAEHGAVSGVILFFTCLSAAVGPLAMGAVTDWMGTPTYGFMLAPPDSRGCSSPGAC